MATSRRRPLVTAPQQQRSRETHAALLQALRRLMRSRAFDAIGVAEIAREAGTSVGGFYARFASKEALLVPMAEDLVGELRESLDAALDAHGVAASLQRIVEAYVSTMVAGFREHRTTLVQLRQAARGETGAAVAQLVHEFNVHAHARFRELALRHRARIRHRAPELAVELAVFMASASAREAVLSENWRSYAVRPDDATVAQEIARATLRYLEG